MRLLPVSSDPKGENVEFKVLFCRRFRCSALDYERRALNRCLYTHARLLAPFLRLVRPRFFDPDLAFIEYLGRTTNTSEAHDAASEFHDKGAVEKGFLGRDLRIRASGFKAIKLARQLFSEEEAPLSSRK